MQTHEKLVGMICGIVMVVGVGGLAIGQETPAAVSTRPVVAAHAMTLVPADAWVAICLRDMASLSRQVDQYVSEVGGAVDIETKWLRKLGMGMAVDTSRPCMFVVMNPQLYTDDPFALIVPIRDFPMAVRVLQAEPSGVPSIMKGRSSEMGQCFLANKSGCVVIAPNQAVVKAILESTRSLEKTINAVSREIMTTADVSVHVNIKGVAPMAGPYLGMMAMMGMMGGAMGGPEAMSSTGPTPSTGAVDAGQQAKMQAMQRLAEVAGVAMELLPQLDSLCLGVKLAPDEIRPIAAVTFNEGSEVGEAVKAQAPVTSGLLKGLGNEAACVVGGYKWKTPMTRFYKMILEMTPPLPDPADAAKYKALTVEAAQMLRGQASRINLNPIGSGKSLLGGQCITEVTNAKRHLEILQQMCELQNKSSVPGSAGQAMTMTATYEKGVATVAGVSVDRYTMDIMSMMKSVMMAAGDMGKQLQGLFTMLFGEKFELLVAAVTPERVVTQFGGDEASLAELIALARAPATRPAAAPAKLAEIRKRLPSSKLAEAYVDVGQIVTTFLDIMQVMTGPPPGAEAPATAPAKRSVTTPLMGVALTNKGTSLVAECVVPCEIVTQLRRVAEMMGVDTSEIGEGIGEIVE